MRDMTPAELDSWYRHHQWPCCGGKEYVPGPRGGMSINLTCPKCGMQINVVDPASHWAQAAPPFGQVLREPSGIEAVGFVTGQAVRVSNLKGHAVDAVVLLASGNGVSLVLEFDGSFWLGENIMYAGRMPVMRSPTGVYRDPMSNQPLFIEPRPS